jgi:histone-lysine N-methyltransferase SETD3
MRRFLDWLKAGGAEFSRLRVTTTARGGRGVVATAAFAPGDVLLRVPEPLLLTVNEAERRPDVAEALQRARSSGVNTNDGNLALALYLAGDDDCFWAPYRQALGGVDHLPLFWPASDLELLAGSPLAKEVESRKDDVAATTSALGLDESFAVAEAHVLSRAFEFDRGKRRAMVPFADLLNTNRHQDRHVDFEFEGDAFVMRAIRSGIEGDEVTDSYGPKSNARYLLNYGFALEDNTDEAGRSRDDAALDVALPERLHGARGHAWLPGCPALRIRVASGDDGAVEHALSAFRVVAASDDEFATLDREHLASARRRGVFGDGIERPEMAARAAVVGLASTPFISRRNELAALTALQELAAETAAALAPPPFDEDESANRRHARIYLEAQRSILEGVAEACAVKAILARQGRRLV